MFPYLMRFIPIFCNELFFPQAQAGVRLNARAAAWSSYTTRSDIASVRARGKRHLTVQ